MAGLSDLRELAHGIDPAVLTDRGLRAAIESLAVRSPVPVTIEGSLSNRPERGIETALYFTAAESARPRDDGACGRPDRAAGVNP